MTIGFADAILDINVSTFCGDRARGNLHRILLLEKYTEATITALEKLSRQTDEIVIGLCLKADTPSASFFQRGQAIQRCGSGNLACAFVLDNLYGLKANQQMITRDGPISLIADNGYYGYQGHHRLAYIESDSRSFHDCFNHAPDQTFLCGGDTDYIIFVYDRAEALTSLQADIPHILKTTQRALIATAPSTCADGDYAIRYFAPQWGNNEDAATGSANAVVGPYWGQRLGLTELHSYQVSAAGGEFWVRLGEPDADCQSVTLLGRCRQI